MLHAMSATKQSSASCTSHDNDDDIHCKTFYLHRICAELPSQIYPHGKHNRHPLTLQLRPDKYVCSVCESGLKSGYACEPCNFNLCVACPFPRPSGDEQRMLHHEGAHINIAEASFD